MLLLRTGGTFPRLASNLSAAKITFFLFYLIITRSEQSWWKGNQASLETASSNLAFHYLDENKLTIDLISQSQPEQLRKSGGNLTVLPTSPTKHLWSSALRRCWWTSIVSMSTSPRRFHVAENDFFMKWAIGSTTIFFLGLQDVIKSTYTVGVDCRTMDSNPENPTSSVIDEVPSRQSEQNPVTPDQLVVIRETPVIPANYPVASRNKE